MPGVASKIMYAVLDFMLPRWPSGKRICLPMQEMHVRFLGTEDPLEEEIAACSSMFACLGNPMDRGAWRGYSLWGHKELDTTENVCIQAPVLYRRILIYAAMPRSSNPVLILNVLNLTLRLEMEDLS